MRVAILFNEPTLPPDHADFAQEAGVLESVEAFAGALSARKHEVQRIGCGDSPARLLARLQTSAADVVVNLCEGFAGHSAGEAHVASLLELLGVAYTGSRPEALALVRDKARTKWLLQGAGLPTAAFALVRRGEPPPREALELLMRGPAIVKPAAEDASLGLSAASVVRDAAEMEGQVALVHQRYGDALVEQFVDGREFNVGVIALPEPRALPLAEIVFGEDLAWPIVTYDAKWRPASRDDLDTPVRCPAHVDAALAGRLRQIAVDAFRLTGCRHYARVDLRVSRAGEPFVLEVNANPDAGPSAGLARALAAAGMGYDEFVARLVEETAGEGSAGRGGMQTQAEPRGAAAEVSIRFFQAADRAALVEMVRATGLFRDDEVRIADEVLEEAARDGDAGHYRTWVAEADGEPVGWSSHGRVPLTDATWDLYWIAVASRRQGQGIGQRLLRHVEDELRAAGARWLLAETSGQPAYAGTRRFYERAGYSVVGDVPDFYRAGDSRVTYGKRLDDRHG